MRGMRASSAVSSVRAVFTAPLPTPKQAQVVTADLPDGSIAIAQITHGTLASADTKDTETTSLYHLSLQQLYNVVEEDDLVKAATAQADVQRMMGS